MLSRRIRYQAMRGYKSVASALNTTLLIASAGRVSCRRQMRLWRTGRGAPSAALRAGSSEA